MKTKRFFLFGLPAVLLALGLVLTGCGGDEDDGGGGDSWTAQWTFQSYGGGSSFMIDNMLSGQHFLAGPSNFSSSDTAMVAALKAAFVVTIGGVEQTILNFDDPSMSPAYVTISGITSSPTEAVTIKYTQPENAAYRCKLGDSDAPSFGPITCTKSARSQ